MPVFEPCFEEVSQRVSELETQSIGSMLGWSQFTKGHNSVKTVMELWYLISAHHLMMLYMCTKFQNISKGFRVIERMGFIY